VVENAQVTYARQESIGHLPLFVVHINEYAVEEPRGADGKIEIELTLLE
jgi:hypothetical protein